MTRTRPIDVPIELPRGPEFVSAAEVFEAEEAGDIFFTYYKTGDLPPGYVLRPVEAWTADGTNLDLRSAPQPWAVPLEVQDARVW